MKKYCIAIFLMLSWGFIQFPALAAAPAGDLTIIELKMTGSETIVIENTAGKTVNLSDYILQYFNKSAPASLAVPADVQQLPDSTLDPGQAILFNSDSAPTCGAAAVAELDFTLSDSGGYLTVVKIDSQTDGSLLYKPQDHVSWTSSAAGADINKVPSSSADPNAVWYRQLSDGSWQQSELSSGCSLLSTLIVPADEPTYVQWASGEQPPSTVVSISSTNGGGETAIPPADIGLAAPQITELLPNVAPPQTDSEDEFIEIYNPNNATFDLSGFKLQVGLTTKHSYTFPAGTTLAPQSFKAFFSIDTGLALSNSGGQAVLFDPLGTDISQTDAYSTAKDGQAWALAKGKWYWTGTPTPSAVNIIKQSSGASSSGSAKTKTTKSQGLVKGASTTAGAAPMPADNVKTASLHPLVLAGVGVLAVVYGLYEYRYDLGNLLYKLRRNRTAR